MLRTLFFVAFATTCFTLHAQEKTDKQKGLLWEISGNGIKRPGYLYGTMHVSEKLVFNLSDSFFQALRNVDMVALETNHDEWQQFMENLADNEVENPFNGNGGNYRNNNQNLYNEAFKFAAPSSNLLGAMLSVKPVMSNEFLYRSNESHQDYEEDTYLDLFIFQAGKKLGKKVIGLETMEGSYESVMRARIPDDKENDRRRNYRPGLSRMSLEDAYRNQDLQMIDSINQMSSPGKNFKRWMLDERNVIMANRIDSILRSGTPIFSAVGAAHLPGDAGVIRLLRSKGYSMRPVQFTNTSGNTEREQIDKIHYPVQTSRHWLIDSTWSAESPGRFFPTFNAQGFEQHLCADMSNGVFYAVYRLKHYGWWTGQTPEYIASRLDSLIYERIPGRIFERKKISEPFPGHEINTRTRRGDVLRFKIFVTPSEMVVFTTGGNNDYALGEEANRFLNSIRFEGKNEKQSTFRPDHGGFRVSFPAPLVVNTTSSAKSQQYFAVSNVAKDSSAYFVYRTELHDWTYIEEDTFELNIIGERIAEQFTRKAPVMKLISTSPYPTQDIQFTSERDSSRYFIRIVIDGPRYYMVGCRKHAAGSPDAFLNSFAIEPMKYPEGMIRVQPDTSMHFAVTALHEPEKPSKAFAERLRKIFEEVAKKRYTRSGDEVYENERSEDYTVVKSPLTGEQVSVNLVETLGSKTLPSVDSFKINLQNTLSRHQKMALKQSLWEEKPGLITGKFLLEDTNSTRGIRAAVFIRNRKTYQLMANVNLQGPSSPFIDSVFSSFTLLDKPNGSSLFGSKDLSFLENIYSTDSLRRAEASGTLQVNEHLELKPADFPRVRAAVEQPGFGKLKFKERSALIYLLGSTQNPEAIGYLSRYFKASRDSARYQAAILEALAGMKTQESFQTLFDLWSVQQPVYTTDAGEGIFESLRDTLRLTAKFIPQILDLSANNALLLPSLGLLNDLLHEGLIKPGKYRRLVPGRIRSTAWWLSKYRFRQETNLEKKGNAYNEDYESTMDESGILNNMDLLYPYLKSSQDVRAVADQVIRYGSDAVKIQIYGLYLKQRIPVEESKLRAFAESDKTAFLLFRELSKSGQIGKYTSWFSDTTALIRSYLMSSTSGVRDMDSVRFLHRHPYLLYNKPAYLYFFEVKQKNDKEWTLAQVVALRSLQFFTQDHVTKRRRKRSYQRVVDNYMNLPQVKVLQNLTEKEKTTYIDKKVGDLRFINRERYKTRAEGHNYYYSED
jgi:uncharacterized protein YbaP (TraB family)